MDGKKVLNEKLLNSYIKAMGENPSGLPVSEKLKIIEQLMTSSKRPIPIIEKRLMEAIVLLRHCKANKLKKKRQNMQIKKLRVKR